MPSVHCSSVRMFWIALGSAATLLFASCSPPEAASVVDSSDGDPIVRGLVLDSMTGQAVDAFCVSLDSWTRVHESHDFLNADGRFRWEGLSEGTYSLVVTADGYEPHFARDVTVTSSTPTQETRFLLQRGRVVQGHVADAVNGAGIEGARVRHPHELESNCEDSQLSTVSDRGGYFVLGGLPRRPIAVEVAAGNYLTKFVAADETVDEYLKIDLSPGAAIHGRLLGPDGGLEHGFIHLTETQTRMGIQTVTADAQGRFEFPGLRAGAYRIEAISASAEWPEVVSEDLSLAPGETIRDLEMRFGTLADMPAGLSSISGTVSGLMKGEQAYVSLEGSSGSHEVGPTGDYEVYGVPAGKRTKVRVHTHMGRTITDTVDVNKGQGARLDFALVGTARLFGRVTRGGKTTWSSVSVWSTMDKSFPKGSAFAADGDYAIAGLRTGEHMVSINGRRLFRIQLNGETRLDVDLCDDQPPPGTSSVEENVWACDNLSFSGKVVASEGGHGLQNAKITIGVIEASRPSERLERSGAQTSTDEFGAFAFRDILAPRKYLLTVYRAGYDVVTRPVLLRESMEDITVALERSSNNQKVQAWERETGRPLRLVQVDVADTSPVSARFSLPLGVDGVGVLPMSLLGHDLTFTQFGYRPYSVSDWGGEHLRLEMSACQPFTEGCHPRPM